MASLSNMSAFEQWLDKAAARGPDRVIPSSVAIAATKDGIIYSHSSGTQSEDPASPLYDKPINPDNVIWIASATKLMTVISILQLLEKGLVDLDADLDAVLPELSDLEVFKGFNEDGSPIYEKAKQKITTRMLLTHQSGMGYEFFQPYIDQIRSHKEKLGQAVPSKLAWESKLNPLIGQPGEVWNYGASYEILGRLIERLTHTTLNAYMQTHIWDPLSMTHTSFSSSSPSVAPFLADAAFRGEDGSIVPSPNHFFPDVMEFDSGGAGLFSSSGDYAKLMSAVLRDDGTLLRPETMAMLFEPQLSPEIQKFFDASVYIAGAEVMSHSLEREARLTHALGGGLCRADVEGRRRGGTLMWAGLANCYWTVDREKGVALFWGSQIMPTSDKEVIDGFRRFEEAVYGGLV
ncbi:hypothetical protein V490_06471 [Pseudogymnoascus sp. VKM F-3557]|nr:hypothetical protein V490_06471 [Pseudogymnoascus sp. VKM F-3557]